MNNGNANKDEIRLSSLIHLSMIMGVGYATVKQFVDQPEALDIYGEGILADFLGISRHITSIIKSKLNDASYTEWVKKERENWVKEGVGLLSWWDPLYPEQLRHIHQAPYLLFYKGNLEYLYQPKIAIVGTRNPTPYGQRVAQRFAEQLSQYGVTVVSGMARGIDGLAHQGALRYGGKSIGVIAGGFRTIYPPEYSQLYKQMGKEGLLLSEYPPHIKPHPSYFPLRNRLISGLSDGVIVVEAAKKSGSLITADLALEQGKEVFCVPGSIFSPQSEGTHNLIKQGATLITDWKEIFDHAPQLQTQERVMQLEHAPILQALRNHGRLYPDQLAELTGIPLVQIMVALLQLELGQWIDRLPGGSYEIR